MKKFLIIVVVAFGIVFGAKAALSATEQPLPVPSAKPPAVKKLTLERRTTLSLREPFTQESIDGLKLKLITMSNSLQPTDEINLFLDTPGGSINAGQQLIEAIKGIPQKVNVVVNFAASMGYMTTQSTTGSRYVTSSGILMAHRAYMGTEGQVPGEFNTRAKFFQDTIEDIEKEVASRVGLTHAAYAKLVQPEHWITGGKAVSQGEADAVVTVGCAPDLAGTSVEVVQTMFGPVGIVWEDCPLILNPVGYDFSSIRGFIEGSTEAKQVQDVVTTVMTNKRAILDSAVLNESFFKLVK